MKSFSSPSVSIDGEVIRRIREEGRLTQLYVSKVVGVTTDTVSRWENNRYPTMRRDNALRLAEALEVDLASILYKLSDTAEEPALKATSVPGRKSYRLYYLLALLVFVLAGIVFTYLRRAPLPANLLSGHRRVPAYTAPGARVPIQLEINSKKKLKGLIVREEFPPGWNLVEADPPPTSLDNLHGNARWMIRNPSQQQKIVYVLQPPENIQFGREVRLQGEVVANPDGQRFAYKVPSKGVLKIAPLHWADMDGNSKIDDLEILEVSDMVDASEKIHYDWDLIEKMWDADGYLFDQKKKIFEPRTLVVPADK
ncbi:MAG: helix-turn-helix domain-containing protein [Geopsychrobacter sp.]|nr:helix-turn-helix domain-containing protein [Geopsychrobacter sp.]